MTVAPFELTLDTMVPCDRVTFDGDVIQDDAVNIDATSPAAGQFTSSALLLPLVDESLDPVDVREGVSSPPLTPESDD